MGLTIAESNYSMIATGTNLCTVVLTIERLSNATETQVDFRHNSKTNGSTNGLFGRPTEFSHIEPDERRLFRFVDLETTVESDRLAIQKQVQWLFLTLYGEHLHLTHTEIEHAVALFDDIKADFLITIPALMISLPYSRNILLTSQTSKAAW